MAYPTDHTDYQTRRMAEVTRELIEAMVLERRAAQRLVDAKAQFIALGLVGIMPGSGDPIQHVHKEPDAPTRQEILDISSVTDHVNYHLFGVGASSPLTNVQARDILARYAK